MGADSAIAGAEAALQLSWVDESLHLWAFDAEAARAMPYVHVVRLADQVLGRHVAASALPSRVGIALPEPIGRTPVPTMRLGLDALADLRPAAPVGSPGPPTVGASLRWFVALADLARAVIAAGRIRPQLTAVGPVHSARWRPIGDLDGAVDDRLATLTTQQPPVCGVEHVDVMFRRMVDAFARGRLGDQAWRPPPPLRARGTDYRAAQATFRALTSESGSVLYRTEDVPALHQLARVFSAEHDRASGVPVIAPQLRIHLPDSEDGAWRVGVELFDVDRPERWCTIVDVVDATALALDVAQSDAHLVRLYEIGVAAAHQLAAAIAHLDGLGTDPGELVELDLEQAATFIDTAPDVLDQLGIRLIGPEQLVRAKAGVRGSATPRAASGANGRFTAGALVTWDATIDDAPIDEAQLEHAAQAGSSLVHVNGRWVRLDARQVRSTLERLQRNREQLEEMDVAALLKLAAESAGQQPAGGGAVITVAGDGWVGDLLAGLPDERLVEAMEPVGFVGALRHYQRRGLSWMGFLARLGLGGCLADDMGLGKTATTLAHLATRPGPHLVVCPLSVVHNWYSEAARFTPHLGVVIHHGGERVRSSEQLSGELLGGDGLTLTATDIVVTTYGLLSRDVELLGEVQWDTLVLDEAQNVKNHLTRAAKAVRQLSARQRLALTGTPVENHLGELWSILDAVNPGLLGSAKGFNDRYVKPIQREQDQDATAALHALTQPFVLRRTKADKTLLPELPDKIEQVAWATLTKEQAAMYQAVVDQLLADAQAAAGMRRRGLVLAALTRLKQICNHPAHAAGDGSRLPGRSGKLNRFDELIDDLLAVDERALVFTQFTEMGFLLQRHLADRGTAAAASPPAGTASATGVEPPESPLAAFATGVPFLHGGVAHGARDRMVRRFQDGEGPPVLIVSLKAGGTGLNLTAASQVIHYDRWWNPAVEDQATDRAWRLGQARTVLVHKLVCEGTLEERIGELIDEKKQLANSVLGTGEAWLTELSTDDLRALVALTPDERPPFATARTAMSAPGAGSAARLASTMIDVLVAEMAEPGRLRRGRQYAKQGAVDALRVEPGMVTANIQGSTPRPYVATARVTLSGADGTRLAALVPNRREIRFGCTCPDDDTPCKHAVALMAEFSQRLAYDETLFLRWRTGSDSLGGGDEANADGSPAAHAGDSPPFDADARAALDAFLGTDLPAFAPAPELPVLAPPHAAWDDVWAEMLTAAIDVLGRPVPTGPRR